MVVVFSTYLSTNLVLFKCMQKIQQPNFIDVNVQDWAEPVELRPAPINSKISDTQGTVTHSAWNLAQTERMTQILTLTF